MQTQIRQAVFLLIIFACSITAQAQGTFERDLPVGSLSGRVYDFETMEPLPNTNIILAPGKHGTATARNGTFEMTGLKPGLYQLVVKRIGYKIYQENVQISPEIPLTRTIALLSTPVKGEAITVTASFREQTANMAPASVDVVNYRELQQRSVITFDQALEAVPGISVHRAGGVSVQSLSIRGSSDVAGGGVGNRVLLLLDGRPAISSDAGGALWSLMPVGAIDRVEVLKGAFSSLYGSTAMGGVVNIITRNPAYRGLTSVEAGFGVYEQPAKNLRFSDKPPLSSQVTLNHSGVAGPFSYLLNFSRKASDGYAQNTGYEFYNIFSKLIYDFRQNRYLELSLGASIAENGYPHTWQGNLQPYRVLPKYRDDLQRKRVYHADLMYRAIPSNRLRYSSRFYLYRNASRSFFNPGDPEMSIPGNQPFGLRTFVDADKFGNLTRLDYILNKKHNLIAGIDVQIDKVNSAPDTIMYGNRQVNNFAFYLQDEWQVSSKLTTNIGLRYDLNHLVQGISQSQFSSNFAAIYQMRPNLTFRFLAGQAFRAPSIAERFFREELSGGTLFKPNPFLRAERMNLSLETGTRWQISDDFELNLAYFRYHYRDMIYWQEISAEEGVVYTLFQVRNLNKALTQGLEVSISFRPFEMLGTKASYTYLDARDQSPGRADDLLPYRIKHSIDLAAQFNWRRFSLFAESRYRGKVEEVFLYPLEAPGAYFLANAKASFAINRGFRVSVAMNNLFNTEYEELARYRMPGRNWLFSVNYQLEK
jgi:outer membrane cobalamin receptor